MTAPAGTGRSECGIDRTRLRPLAVLLVTLVVAAAACSGSDDSDSSDTTTTSNANKEPGTVLWPAPDDPLTLTRDAGLEPETAERLQYHVHSHLDVFVDGEKVIVPGGIGINTNDAAVQRGEILGYPAFGGITQPCDQPCISPLHTHDVSGIVHTESATEVENTLGQFFTEWDVALDESCVGEYCSPDDDIAIYLDGEQFTGDPRTIPLTNMLEIAIVIGRPPAEIPSEGDFSQL